MNFNLTRKLRIDFSRTQNIVNKKTQELYKSEEYYSEFFDMIWLRHQLWPEVRHQSLIFDSYHCMLHQEMGVGHPWPTR